MSRVGHLPVEIPEKVEVSLDGSIITVKGPKGELTEEFSPRLNIEIDDELVISRISDSNQDKALHGLTRSSIINMIEGVTEGYQKKLELNGVGYRALKKGSKLELQVGYSHPVVIEPEEGISFEVDGSEITVKGIDKQLVGQVAANIRAVRKPEPYNGKGIKYADERIRRKEGKTA
ncbi:ribosomal protein L6, bacterial type [Halobacteroides halobius DSM 5150]|uniref:Large ribosomal subunit protein uL6 n=1 Tax=Halobacteroides halobius (strain ATCC 35273 / DSM 5150 / MD-1) TaxID=748449 RepID=L0K5C4_HALHC|nr:50S ribosomal protein L6 [Halobacteroides halobius]AGB40216.1 ribosomal protein L6, bacterial type [Halobacteroides halobius DSM 5150]